MKLLIIIIIIIVIYFVLTKIKVVHIDALPDHHREEVANRTKIRSMLLHNHIKTVDNVESYPNKNIEKFSQHISSGSNNQPLSGKKLFKTIKLKYLDTNYKFNISNQPVTSRYPSEASAHLDKKYLKQIKNNISGWNKLIKLRELKLIFVMETEKEFVAKANVELVYMEKTLHLQLMYYGQIKISDDYLDWNSVTYELQLTDIKPILKKEYYSYTGSYQNHMPFMSMEKQLEYVDRINKLHKTEINSER